MADDLTTLAKKLTSGDQAVREEAARALAEGADRRAAPYLLHALDDDSEQVRMWGAYGLGMMRRREDLPALKKALVEDGSALVRLWAAFGSVNLGEKTEAATLVSFLDEDSLDVRNNAADALLSLASRELV